MERKQNRGATKKGVPIGCLTLVDRPATPAKHVRWDWSKLITPIRTEGYKYKVYPLHRLVELYEMHIHLH